MKKIFKAILAISIIGAMALGFAACGGNGGSDAIAVISREEGSGTRGAFVELTGVEVDKVDKTVATAEISSSRLPSATSPSALWTTPSRP